MYCVLCSQNTDQWSICEDCQREHKQIAKELPDTTRRVVDALLLVVLDHRIRGWLEKNDPNAGKQAISALRGFFKTAAQTRRRETRKKIRQCLEAHEEGAEADAGFDGGEFSGPAHTRAAFREIGVILAAAGYTTTPDDIAYWTMMATRR